MKAVFADTFFYLALLSRDDSAHPRASNMLRTLTTPTVTTAWVMTEVGDACAGPRYRSNFLDLLESLNSDPSVTIVAATQELFERGVDLYARRPDKHWTLTDCISFEVMLQRGLTDALTGDRHFEQAGFKALLI